MRFVNEWSDARWIGNMYPLAKQLAECWVFLEL